MRREFVLELPWKIDGNRFFFYADDFNHAEEIVMNWLHDFQDVCEHRNFVNGKCTECQFKCDHFEEITNNACVTCGKYIEAADPRCEPEYYEER